MTEAYKDENAIDVMLMHQLATGSEAALESLISRHQQRVFALAIRTLGSVDLAEDATQDIFVKLFQTAPKYEPVAKFTTWLYRIVVNHCLDIRRKNKNKPVNIEAAIFHEDNRTSDSLLEQTEQARQIRQVVDTLPERQRMVIILHRFQGLSHKEVSTSTGWSVSAVESLINRAYKNLREKLSDFITSNE